MLPFAAAHFPTIDEGFPTSGKLNTGRSFAALMYCVALLASAQAPALSSDNAGVPLDANLEKYPALGAALRHDAAGFLYKDRASFHDVFAGGGTSVIVALPGESLT